MKIILQSVIILLSCFVLSCGNNRQEQAGNDIPEVDEELARVKRVSDSLQDIYNKKEADRTQAMIKQQQGYDATDTIPFGNLRIVIQDAKVNVVSKGKQSDAFDTFVRKTGRQKGLVMNMTVINLGNKEEQLPYVAIDNSGTEETFTLGFSIYINKKTGKLVKDITIGPHKTLDLICQTAGHGNASVIYLLNENAQSIQDGTSQILESRGDGVYTITDVNADKNKVKVDLKTILDKENK
ncbi:MAG: hypothetical protein E6767_01035 [Dysgonomonas sp.]|nr:hypothetical protein [Dysgonomonas sp.]